MGKEIRADIIIGGHADGSLTQLGDSISELGRQVNQISQALIDFGKQGVSDYQDYEDAMLDAQVALATTYTNASDLSKVMEELDKNALQWAQDSRFTTNDVAGAIDNAAHAGWNLEQILSGIPAAMRISQAGGMNLSEGLQLLVDISNAAGISFEDLAEFTDIWAYAANSSSTDISEMGTAMQKMGATMQFVGGDMAALTTMLAVLANNGAKGTEAGTLLRNSMIRLIAPTQKAADAMAGLSLSEEDLDDIYANADAVAEAGRLLEEAGFSAYDANGNMKEILTIWEELSAAVSGMTDENRNNVLSAIFPTRTITGALALLDAAANGWDGLYDSMNANAKGYATFGALLMESGMGGALRHLTSVMNTTSTRAGAALSGDVTSVADALSGFLEGVNGLDDAQFNGLVSGLETIALAGPALMGAGAGIKLMSMLFGTGPGGWLAMAGIGMLALANGVASYGEAVAEADFEAQFGELSFDESRIGQYIAGMSEGYAKTASAIEEYNLAVEKAFGSYEDYSGELKQTLLSQLITKSELTEADKQNLKDLGTNMQQAIIDGINAQQGADKTMIDLLSGGDYSEDAEGSAMWSAIMDTLEFGYESAKARASHMGAELRRAMTSAFADDQLSQEEIDAIDSIMQQMAEIEAERLSADNAAAKARLISKGQQLGIAGLSSASQLVYDQRDAILANMEELFYGEGGTYASLMYGARRKVQAGIYSQEEMDAEIAAAEAAYAASRARESAGFDRILADMFDAAMRDSEFGDAWRMMSGMTGDGNITDEEYDQFYRTAGLTNIRNLASTMGMLMDAMGGFENVRDLRNLYARTGDTDMADFYNSMLMNYAMSMAASEDQINGLGVWMNQIGIGSAQNAEGITVPVDGDTTELEAAINSYEGREITVKIHANRLGAVGKFAEGGRAVEASIFGEAGPEWAIPEEHSQRTAELLAAAAKASGFTWPELLSRNGGMNAGGSSGWTLVYSPTIQANDAGGVEQKLREDKDRLERLLRDRKLLDEIGVYQS